MEEVSELAPLQGLPSPKEAFSLSSEEERTGGNVVVEGQFSSDQVVQLGSSIQNLNLDLNLKMLRVPRGPIESIVHRGVASVDGQMTGGLRVMVGRSLGFDPEPIVPGSVRAHESLNASCDLTPGASGLLEKGDLPEPVLNEAHESFKVTPDQQQRTDVIRSGL